jgi:polysaccharide biosynthesis transport protein
MELKQYISPLLKWWWLVLGSTLVAAFTSIYAVSQQPDLYQARSALMLGQAINNPNPTNQEFFLTQQLGQTYVNIANRAPVRQATMDALGLDWLPAYTVELVPNTQLIEIKVNDTSPERAMAVSNELARQIVLSSPTSAQEQEEQERQEFIKTQLDDLQAQIKATNEEILAKETELAEMISARQIADTQSQIAALETKFRALQTNYIDLLYTTQQGAINSLTVFEEAIVPIRPIGPDRVTTVLTAAAIGFVLGAAAAYLLEYLDDTIKTPADVDRVANLSTLAGVASFKTTDSLSSGLISMHQPRSPSTEDYRNLRTAILFANVDENIKTILITSPGPGEGKSFTAANLAVVMAQAGKRVLLIDADLRRPVQHKIFDRGRNLRGLTTLLFLEDLEFENNQLPPETFFQTQQQRLVLLTSGPLPPNPAEVVGSGKMKMILDALLDHFDFIIIDSPPVLAVTDPLVLATRTDGTVLVARASRTRRDQLQQTAARLQEVNSNLLGVMLNYLSPKRGTNYYYYYHYGSNYKGGDIVSDDNVNGSKGKRKRFRRFRKKNVSEPLPDAFVGSGGDPHS